MSTSLSIILLAKGLWVMLDFSLVYWLLSRSYSTFTLYMNTLRLNLSSTLQLLAK